MDTAKTNTLQQVNEAIREVDKARRDPAVSGPDEDILEETAVSLREIQDNIMAKSEQALVDALTTDAAGLNALIDRINKASDKLDKISASLAKLNNALVSLSGVVTAALKAGL